MAEQKSPIWGGVAVPGDLAGGLCAWGALLPARQEHPTRRTAAAVPCGAENCHRQHPPTTTPSDVGLDGGDGERDVRVMKAAPVRRQRRPDYPTRLEVQSDSCLRRRRVPPAWRTVPEMAGDQK